MMVIISTCPVQYSIKAPPTRTAAPAKAPACCVTLGEPPPVEEDVVFGV